MKSNNFFPFPQRELIGVLGTGAGAITTFSARDHCDMYLMLGDVDTALPITGLTVDVGGVSKINLTGSAPLWVAISKYLMNLNASTLGMVIRISNGRINKTTTIKITNAGATTPNIYSWSDAKLVNGKAPAVLDISTVGIQPANSADFSKFSALFITSAANVGSIDMDFKDGHSEPNLTVLEVDAMLAMTSSTEANGRLDPLVTTIDNRPSLGRPVETVRIRVPNGGTAVTVATLSFDEADWVRLTK